MMLPFLPLFFSCLLIFCVATSNSLSSFSFSFPLMLASLTDLVSQFWPSRDGDPQLQFWQRLITEWEECYSRSSATFLPSTREIHDPEMSGWLYHQTGILFKSWKRRWCVLKGMFFFVFENPESAGPLFCLILHRAVIDQVDADGGSKPSFVITPFNQESYQFCAKTVRDCMLWMENTMRAVSAAVNDPNTRRHIRVVPPHIKNAIRDGIPDLFRGIVWFRMSGGFDKLSFHPGLYQQLKSKKTKEEARIVRDIGRTCPHDGFFRGGMGERGGQAMLANVVRAYAVYDQEVGYCQGINFLTANLLLHMREEEAFWCLERLLNAYSLRSLFLSHNPELLLKLHTVSIVLDEVCPPLSSHFDSQNVDVGVHISQWILTIFSYGVSREMTDWIWDWFFVDGANVLTRIAVAILVMFQKELLTMGFEDILFFLKDAASKVSSPPLLIKAARELKWDEEKIERAIEEKRIELSLTFHDRNSNDDDENENERSRKQSEEGEGGGGVVVVSKFDYSEPTSARSKNNSSSRGDDDEEVDGDEEKKGEVLPDFSPSSSSISIKNNDNNNSDIVALVTPKDDEDDAVDEKKEQQNQE